MPPIIPARHRPLIGVQRPGLKRSPQEQKPVLINLPRVFAVQPADFPVPQHFAHGAIYPQAGKAQVLMSGAALLQNQRFLYH